jgi:hypothetical protein
MEMAVLEESIISKIYLVRGQKVMLDRDLAEFSNWRSQIVTSNNSGDKMGLRYAPYCFTEQGVTMLSCVLSSDRAIKVNIMIIRVFNRMREMLLTHKDILLKLDQLEKQVTQNSEDIRMIFAALKQLLTPPESPRQRIGFKT